MKEVKISRKLVEAYNKLEGFMFKNCVKVTDEDGETYFAFINSDREIRLEFEKLCDNYHHLVRVEAEANGVAPSVIDDYFNSVCRRKKDFFDYKKYIEGYTFDVDGTLEF